MHKGKSKIGKRIYLLCFLGLLFGYWYISSSLPWSYTAESVEGWVVDVETGEPLDKVIVIAVWELEAQYGFDSTISKGYMEVSEVLTDAQGHYTIPGWGPKRRAHRSIYLGNADPKLAIFKPGYLPLVVYNRRSRGKYWDKRDQSVHRSDWNGKTIKLERFRGDDQAYIGRLNGLDSALRTVTARHFGTKKCRWGEIPQMILLFDQYHRTLKGKGAFFPSLKYLSSKGGCDGSADDFKRKYQD